MQGATREIWRVKVDRNIKNGTPNVRLNWTVVSVTEVTGDRPIKRKKWTNSFEFGCS